MNVVVDPLAEKCILCALGMPSKIEPPRAICNVEMVVEWSEAKEAMPCHCAVVCVCEIT